ncbi:MAG: amidohydrolase [Candidatus Diapherotrites archaeon]|nr:amidohydrolase [Candidatus Diapherotrites archaeon]
MPAPRKKGKLPRNYILVAAKKVFPEMVRLRRNIHSQPELSFREFKTTRLVLGELKKLGIVGRVTKAKTGVIATINGSGKGRTIAIRADMDALPIQETTGLSFASKRKGVMHACGHDSHIAVLLGLAKILTEYNRRHGLPGNIRLIFQPGEESGSRTYGPGSSFMVNEGAMKGVSAVLGFHFISEYKLGRVHVRKGIRDQAISFIKFSISSDGGHGASNSEIPDIVAISAKIRADIDRIYNPQKPSKLRAVSLRCDHGQVSGTDRFNVMPTGITHTLAFRASVPEKERTRIFKKLLTNIRGAYLKNGKPWKQKGLRFRITSIEYGLPATENDPKLAELAKEVAKEHPDVNAIYSRQTVGSEDFSGYTHSKLGRIPGLYISIGTSSKELIKRHGGRKPDHHESSFDIDERAMRIAVSLLAETCIRYLNKR